MIKKPQTNTEYITITDTITVSYRDTLYIEKYKYVHHTQVDTLYRADSVKVPVYIPISAYQWNIPVDTLGEIDLFLKGYEVKMDSFHLNLDIPYHKEIEIPTPKDKIRYGMKYQFDWDNVQYSTHFIGFGVKYKTLSVTPGIKYYPNSNKITPAVSVSIEINK